MKIKSNMTCNTSHTVGNIRIQIPAEATLELDDVLHAGHVPWLARLEKKGNIVFIKKPAKSEEQKAKEAAAKLEAARKLVAEADAAAKNKGK